MARRDCGGDAEDVVQEALLAAVRAGRTDLADAETGRWLAGVVRNQARMHARGSARRRNREAAWVAFGSDVVPIPEPNQSSDRILSRLPPGLRIVALLALTGHSRREIAWLLRLEDAALRQRVAQLRSRFAAAGLGLPSGMPGLSLDLAYGRIRDALRPLLARQGGVLASHDPDGHLFALRCSQKP